MSLGWNADMGTPVPNLIFSGYGFRGPRRPRKTPSVPRSMLQRWPKLKTSVRSSLPLDRSPGHVLPLIPVARLEQRHKEIQEDDSIPTRGKKGVKSKKQTRDETLEVVREELKELSIESGWTTGKW